MADSTDSRPRSIELADGVMLTVAILWASNNVITKAALDRGLEPIIYIVLRFATVAALLFPYLWFRKVPLRIQRSDWPRFIVSGLCGFTFYNLLYIVGLSHTSAYSAAIMVALAPIFILIISAVFGLEQVRRMQWAGVALSFLGVAIFIGDKLLSGEPATGDLLNVTAALCFAVYGLTTKPLVLRYGPEPTTAWAVMIGLVAILPFTAGAVRDEDWASLSGLEWFSIAYAAIVSVMIGYSLWSWAIARTGAGRSVPYLFLIPVFTGLFGVILGTDHLEAAQLVGGAIALAGVAVARKSAERVEQPENIIPAEETGMAPEAESRPRAVPGP